MRDKQGKDGLMDEFAREILFRLMGMKESSFKPPFEPFLPRVPILLGKGLILLKTHKAVLHQYIYSKLACISQKYLK